MILDTRGIAPNEATHGSDVTLTIRNELDRGAYRHIREHFELLRNIVQRLNGTFVKTIDDSVMAASLDSSNVLAASLERHTHPAEDNAIDGPQLTLKIGIHTGPCFAVDMNGTLDYFGTTVNVAARIQKESWGGNVVVTDEVCADLASGSQLRYPESSF